MGDMGTPARWLLYRRKGACWLARAPVSMQVSGDCPLARGVQKEPVALSRVGVCGHLGCWPLLWGTPSLLRTAVPCSRGLSDPGLMAYIFPFPDPLLSAGLDRNRYHDLSVHVGTVSTPARVVGLSF